MAKDLAAATTKICLSRIVAYFLSKSYRTARVKTNGNLIVLRFMANFEDTVISGDEENQIAEKVNQLFGTHIGLFEYKNF